MSDGKMMMKRWNDKKAPDFQRFSHLCAKLEKFAANSDTQSFTCRTDARHRLDLTFGGVSCIDASMHSFLQE